MSNDIAQTRAKITEIGRLLFERRLNDAGGGNISIRCGDVVCMSPAYSGHLRQWALRPEEVLVLDMDGNKLEGEGSVSRERRVHLALHKAYGEHGDAVIHCHPHNLMVFAAMGVPMPPVLEATLKFGVVPVAAFAPAHSPNLADNILAAFESMDGPGERIAKHAAGVVAPWHGLFLMGRHIDAAFDGVERFDTNAYCIMMARGMGVDLTERALALQAQAAAWGKA